MRSQRRVSTSSDFRWSEIWSSCFLYLKSSTLGGKVDIGVTILQLMGACVVKALLVLIGFTAEVSSLMRSCLSIAERHLQTVLPLLGPRSLCFSSSSNSWYPLLILSAFASGMTFLRSQRSFFSILSCQLFRDV